MFTEINKSNASEIHKEIEQKLAELRELGLDITLGTFRGNSSEFRAKIECKFTDGKAPTVRNFATESEIRDPSKIGKPVMVHGKRFSYQGINPGAYKNKCIIKTSRGAEYVCAPEDMEWIK